VISSVGITAPFRRLEALTMALARERLRIAPAEDLLLSAEQRDYLSAIGRGIGGVDEAWVVLAGRCRGRNGTVVEGLGRQPRPRSVKDAPTTRDGSQLTSTPLLGPARQCPRIASLDLPPNAAFANVGRFQSYAVRVPGKPKNPR
jgi:hypothetical protein